MFLKSGLAGGSAGHYRNMSLPAIAIIVASVSALFTGANMIASWMTYRRSKPRIRARVTWEAKYSEEGGGYPNIFFRVHLVNRSASPIAVFEAKVVARMAVGRHSRIPLKYYAYEDWPAVLTTGETVAPGLEKEIPAFGGLMLEVEADFLDERPTWPEATVVVTLPTGEVLLDRWLPTEHARRERHRRDATALE
ncbi:hypothetical protein AB0K53_11975 [Streptomyces tuirus]|uniref:hypothetical protein n=1 Tax=Streptomyces tuirus TaxID=68278 RepID=UPI0034246722